MSEYESDAHAIAALAQCLITDDHAGVQAALGDLQGRGLGSERPRVAGLVDDPRFVTLRDAVAERGVTVEVLDGVVDRFLTTGPNPKPSSPLETMLAPLVAAAASGQDVDALLDQLRTQLRAQNPDRSPEELDAFIGEFEKKLAAFRPS